MTVNKKTASVGRHDAFGSDANIEMIRRERRANNAWNKLRRNKVAMIGLFIVLFMTVMALLAPVLAPYPPNQIKPSKAFLPPGSSGHLFGTDDLGRDLLSRIMYGGRISLIVAVGATIVGAVAGILLGLLSGYCGGWIDSVIMRIMDGMFSFPFILLAMILITVIGSGVPNVILAIGIANVPSFARVVRGQVHIVKREEYINAGNVLGLSHLRQVFLHILPNTMSQIIVYATLRIADAIISEAFLSFLGLGIELPTASWGSILKNGRETLTSAPHIATIAGLFILVTVLGFNLFGDGIRDVFDPKMKQ